MEINLRKGGISFLGFPQDKGKQVEKMSFDPFRICFAYRFVENVLDFRSAFLKWLRCFLVAQLPVDSVDT